MTKSFVPPWPPSTTGTADLGKVVVGRPSLAMTVLPAVPQPERFSSPGYHSRRNVTTSTSRNPGCAGSSGSTGVTPCMTRASSTSAASQRFGQGEARPAVCPSGRGPRSRRSAMLRRFDQQHQHVVHAVAVHALGRRAAGLAAARLDAELVHLDMPGLRAGSAGRTVPRQKCSTVRHGRAGADRRQDRLEPPLDPAIQRVVVAALVMRLVRLASDRRPPRAPNTARRRFR